MLTKTNKMPKISQKGVQMPESPIRKLVPYAEIAKKKGKEPKLVEGVKVVPAGVIRIMELQSKGYAYIRP